MSVALRRAAHRAIALATGLWLLGFGILGTRHVALVAHSADRAGELRHGAALTTPHTAQQSDIHATRADADADACAIAAVLHQAATTKHPLAVLPTAVAARAIEPAQIEAARVTRSVFRIAPKTSPPVS